MKTTETMRTISPDSRRPFTIRIYGALCSNLAISAHLSLATTQFPILRTNGRWWLPGSKLLVRDARVIALVGQRALIRAAVPSFPRWDSGLPNRLADGNKRFLVVDREGLRLVG